MRCRAASPRSPSPAGPADRDALVGPGISRGVTGAEPAQRRQGELAPGRERIGICWYSFLGKPCWLDREPGNCLAWREACKADALARRWASTLGFDQALLSNGPTLGRLGGHWASPRHNERGMTGCTSIVSGCPQGPQPECREALRKHRGQVADTSQGKD